MKVRDAMARTVTCASPGDSLRDAARAMRAEDAGFLPVVDDGRLVGVLTDRDIVIRWIAEEEDDPHDARVGEVMSTAVRTVAPEDDLDDAARIMSAAEVRRLVVVEEGGRLAGVLSHGNLVQATAGEGPAKEATTGVTRGA
jgi:CBS domain-containing protein